MQIALSDKKDWLKNVGKDPNFSFCFNGMELFFSVSCPHYKILKNRNLGKFITFIINPREILIMLRQTIAKKDKK